MCVRDMWPQACMNDQRGAYPPDMNAIVDALAFAPPLMHRSMTPIELQPQSQPMRAKSSLGIAGEGGAGEERPTKSARSQTAMSFRVDSEAQTATKLEPKLAHRMLSTYESVGRNDVAADEYDYVMQRAAEWQNEENEANMRLGMKEMREEIQGNKQKRLKVRRSNRMKLVGKLRKMQHGLRKAFLEIDNDGNAQIDKSEVALMMLAVDPGMTPEEIEAVQDFMFEGDEDGEEGVSYPEFAKSFGVFIDALEGPR